MDGQNVHHTHHALNAVVKLDQAVIIIQLIAHQPPDHARVITVTVQQHLAVCHMDPHTDIIHIAYNAHTPCTRMNDDNNINQIDSINV